MVSLNFSDAPGSHVPPVGPSQACTADVLAVRFSHPRRQTLRVGGVSARIWGYVLRTQDRPVDGCGASYQVERPRVDGHAGGCAPWRVGASLKRSGGGGEDEIPSQKSEWIRERVA